MRPILLVSILLPLSAYGMQTLDDEQLSDTTGQAGVTVTAAYEVAPTANYRIVDTDGFTGYGSPGQIVMKGYGIKTGNLAFRHDVGSNGSNSVYSLGISALGNDNIKLFLSELGLAGSTGASARHGIANYKTSMIFNPKAAACSAVATCEKYTLLEMVPGGEIRMDLGAQPTGSLININNLQLKSLVVNGGYSIVDASAPANGLTIGSVEVRGASDGNINLGGTTYNLDANGLVLTMGGSSKLNLYMKDMTAGTIPTTAVPNPPTPSMGSLSIIGMDLSGATIRMKGH